MKKIFSYMMVSAALISFAGCHVNDPFEPHYADYEPPQPPSGIVIMNGDERVDIAWNHNRESDVAGYNVYYNYEYDGEYTLIGSTEDNYFIDRGVSNGTKYYYAVAAYDYNGNESELSYDYVYAAPRPEGFNEVIFEYTRFPEISGYTFLATDPVVPYDDPYADFFFEYYIDEVTGIGDYFISTWVYETSLVIDMGLTADIYDIPFAPETDDPGWTYYAEAVPGHTYVVWTEDRHFAKVRVKSIANDRLVFDWAFQLVEGEYQLKPRTNNGSGKEKLLRRKRSE